MAKDELDQPLSDSEGTDTVSDRTVEVAAEHTAYGLSEGTEAEAPSPEEQTAEEQNSFGSDSYFEDDEQWGASADQVLHQDETTAIVQQEEAVVSWDIQGLYDESGKVRSKRSLRNNPPMLVVSDSSGANATFVLTKELSGILARHFDNAHRAYYGIRPKDELTFKEKMSEAKTGIQRNMGKVIIIGGMLLGLLIFGLVF